MRKKFVRKKAKTQKEGVVYSPLPQTQPAFPNETMYEQHFVYWKSWQQELIGSLGGGNEKKLVASAFEAVAELKAMQRYLAGEHQAKLDPYIRQLEGYQARITGRFLNEVEARSLQAKLQQHQLAVEKAFSLSRVRSWITPGPGETPKDPHDEGR